MSKINFLLAGESWVSASTHYKGWDFFSSTVYETGVEYLEKAFVGTEINFVHMPSHIAALDFPMSMDDLNNYDVICLSDIGANTLQLHPDTWLHGKSVPNRLNLLTEWVKNGGGLMMCGGYLSFAGIYGSAKYFRTPIESVLPVNIFTFDDRIETPEGAQPEVLKPNHPLINDLGSDWPTLLGFNELEIKPEADLVVEINQKPLLATMEIENGRSVVWASDIGPHWCPTGFLEWAGYNQLWINTVKWLAKQM